MSDGKEVLVVVSKLKNYVKSEGGLNTAGNVGEALSELVRQICKVAIENAKKDGRKTLMDRDLPNLPLHS
jgi:histone H3/H4